MMVVDLFKSSFWMVLNHKFMNFSSFINIIIVYNFNLEQDDSHVHQKLLFLKIIIYFIMIEVYWYLMIYGHFHYYFDERLCNFVLYWVRLNFRNILCFNGDLYLFINLSVLIIFIVDWFYYHFTSFSYYFIYKNYFDGFIKNLNYEIFLRITLPYSFQDCLYLLPILYQINL
jgi:hypothetical protein